MFIRHALQHRKAEITEANTYRVKKGDTLSSIAVKYRTTVNTLCRLNGISKNKILRLGQPIRVK